ncbi:MAG: GspE/PulE family protein, partial [Solirubrobacteraceae bacterium]
MATGTNQPSHLRPVPVTGGAPAPAEKPPIEPWNGITGPTRRGGSGRFLTDVIEQLGFLDRERIEEAVAGARTAGVPPERILLDSGAITDDQLALAVAERCGLDHLSLTEFKIDMAAANAISSAAARRYEAVPVAHVDERTLAMVDPSNVLAVDDIAMMTGLEVRPAVASRSGLSTLIQRLNQLDIAVQEAVDQDARTGEAEVVDLYESADDAPVIKLVHSIIAQAVEAGASDIHFEPTSSTGDNSGEMRVRFRVDGILTESAIVPRRMVAGVVSRVKIMADLDIAERRVP